MRMLIAGVAALAACVVGVAQAGTLLFTLQGTNPDGRGTYSGTIALTEVSVGANGEKAGTVTWRVGRGAPVVGVALTTTDSPSRISLAFPGTQMPGVGLGQIMDDGSVRLQWFTGGNSAGREVWTPRRP